MFIDDELRKEILEKADIVKIVSSYLKVTKKGKNYVAVCPFHDDTNPSLSISPEKRLFKCFVCGAGGDAITFVQKYEKVSYVEALKKVASLVGVSDPRLESFSKAKQVDPRKAPLLKCLKDLTLYYQYALNMPEGKIGLDYFEGRHLDANLRAKFQLGYAFQDGKATVAFLQSKGHSLKTIEDIGIASISGGTYYDKNQSRAMFPICDPDGNVIGYSARRIKDTAEAKYINSPETYLFHKSSILYNYHIAKEKARLSGYVYVLEGFMDVFALARIGIDSAVAIMGTALTNEHIDLLRKLNCEIRLCLDGDLAGQTAAMKASKQLLEAGLKCVIVDNQNNVRDPDEILTQDGEEALKRYLNNTVGRIDFALNYFKNSNPLKTAEQKKKLIKEFLPILSSINSQLDFENYLRKLSSVTGYEVEALRKVVAKSKNSPDESTTKKIIDEYHPERKVLRRLELAERELLYQMLTNPAAVDYYEQNINGFYDEVYRQIANFLVDYAKKNPDFSMFELTGAVELSNLDDKEKIIEEMTKLLLEKTHPINCDQDLLNSLGNSIKEEKEKIFEKDILENSLEGKDPLTQARLIAEFNRRKVNKKN